MKCECDFDIDSNCYAPPIGAEGPTDAKCGDDATTYVMLPSGARKYICRAHAEEVERFDVVDEDGEVVESFADEDHPVAVVCEACQKLTPKSKIDFEKRCEECQI